MTLGIFSYTCVGEGAQADDLCAFFVFVCVLCKCNDLNLNFLVLIQHVVLEIVFCSSQHQD